MMNRKLIFTATYNEGENIVPLYTHILGLDSDYDLLVVDDNSPDVTGRLLDEFAATHPMLKVVHRSGKLGLGSAHELAMECGCEGGV